MRLIDADALKQEVLRIHEEHFKNSKLQFIHDFFKAILRRINKAPTIEAEPVRYGRWKSKGMRDGLEEKHCSMCDGLLFVRWYDRTMEFRYCPNCGAKMDLEE